MTAAPVAASAGEFALFCRGLASLLDAGVGVRDALARMGDTAPRPYRGLARRAASRLEGSTGVVPPLAAEPGLFPRLAAAVAGAAEAAGRLPGTLRALADHYEEEQRMEDRLRAGLWMPLVTLGLAALMVLVGGPVLNDALARGFEGLSDEPAGQIVPYAPGWWAAGAVAAVLAWKPVLRRIGPLRAAMDALLDAVPLVAGLRVRLARARFLGTMAMALDAGLLLPEAFTLAGEAAGRRGAALAGREAARRAREGMPPADCVAAVRLLDGVGRGAFATWGEAGSLEGLAAVARLERSEAGVAASGVVAMARLAAILAAALIVGWILVSFYSNMWSATLGI